ncbi:hypothetical protein LEMLEM_LOCUS23335, partial [Lemmus lemmus]
AVAAGSRVLVSAGSLPLSSSLRAPPESVPEVTPQAVFSSAAIPPSQKTLLHQTSFPVYRLFTAQTQPDLSEDVGALQRGDRQELGRLSVKTPCRWREC